MITNYHRKVGTIALPFTYPPGYSDGAAVNFAGATLKFVMTARGLPLGVPKVNAAAVITAGNTFSYAPILADVDTAGDFYIEWQVTYASGKKEIWPDQGYLLLRLDPRLV